MRSRLVVFVSIVQAILFLAHWFVYATVAHFWGGGATSWAVKLAFALLSVSFVAASLRGWYSYQPLVRFFYLISAIWLGFASFFLLASVASWIVYGLTLAAGLGWRPAWIADVAFAGATGAGLYGVLNAAWPRVVRITVALPNLPTQWRGRTAALVSDLHLGHVRNGRFIRRVVNKLLALKSDIVFVAGDLYDGVAGDFEKLALPWTDLVMAPKAAALGVYYIAGNHEEFYRNAEYLPPLLRAGIQVLNNEKVEVDGLQLVGVHYRDAVNPDQYRSTLRGMQLDRERASVLLLHAPVRLPISEEEGISFQLSGHTHGGQIFPWTMIAKRVWRKFNHGLQQFGALQVYTTYGTGTWGPPLRLGTRPEIVMITFA
ncbi:MAG TPA: metallophosphoesterase [Candidatus Polarisedimenticolia bacterium]|nr:metallophosphoesterase [Candidatus Polarisedimenticolia bacterium]